MTKQSRWIIGILIAIAVLAGIQWWMNSQPNAFFNTYGNPPADASATASSTAQDVQAATSTISAAVNNQSIKNFMHDITIDTSKGKIVFETYDSDAPNTVQNFIKLANSGFYNGTLFHRVIEGFMIQAGDPLTKDPSKQSQWGTGGPGYQFADELNAATPSYKAGYVRGTVAMANSGPNTNGSQFFIMQQDNALAHNYTIFGKVISGMDVVDAIAATQVNASDRPLTNISINGVSVVNAQ